MMRFKNVGGGSSEGGWMSNVGDTVLKQLGLWLDRFWVGGFRQWRSERGGNALEDDICD